MLKRRRARDKRPHSPENTPPPPPVWCTNRITRGAAAGEIVWGYSRLWGGVRLAICAWKEPDGGSNQLVASSRSVHLHLQEEMDLPDLNPPLLHRKSWTPQLRRPLPKPFLFHCVAPTWLYLLAIVANAAWNHCTSLHCRSAGSNIKTRLQLIKWSNNL